MIALDSFLERTMLIERVYGVLAYAFVVLLGYFLIRQKNTRKRLAICLISLLFLLLVMAFFFVPDSSKDLYRLWDLAIYYSKYDAPSFFSAIFMKSNEPMGLLFLYIGGKIGVMGLLPAFSALVFYTCVFSIIYLLKKEKNISDYSLANVYLLIMCSGSFLEVISDLRSFVAICIVSYCFVAEMVFKRPLLLHLPIYAFACFFHTTAIPLFLLRLIVVVFEQKALRKKILYLIFVSAILVFVFLFGRTYIESAIAKGVSYFSNNVYSYFWEYCIGILQVVVMSVFLFETKKISSLKNTGFKKLVILSIIGLCLCIVEYNTFHRYLIYVSIIFAVYYALLSDKLKSNDSRIVYLKYGCLAILLLAMVRGNLCGYKFFALS